MKRKVQVVWLAAAALLLMGAGVQAQGLGVPPGKWWERPRVVEELGITSEQKQRLEAVTYQSARAMIDLKSAVDKAELDLRVAGDGEPFDPRSARQAFVALQQARQRLETERFELLIKVREVLTREQWQQLREMTQALRERIKERRPDGPPAAGNRLPRRRD